MFLFTCVFDQVVMIIARRKLDANLYYCKGLLMYLYLIGV